MRFSFLFWIFICISQLAHSQCALTIEPADSPGCVKSYSEAVFSNLANTTASGNSVEKTSGGNGWSGGALSTARIINNGYAETVIGETNTSRIFGLSHSNNRNQNNINTVEYGFLLRNWGGAEIRESGSFRAYIWNYSIGDTLKIAVEDGTVNYYINSELLYTSSENPTLPLYVDLAFQHENSRIEDVRIINKTSAVIHAFSNQPTASINSFQWYKNNDLLSETSSQLTLSDFSYEDVIFCTATQVSGSCNGVPSTSNKMTLRPEANLTEQSFRISALPVTQGCFLAQEDVFWQANIPANMDIDGNNVTKTQGYNTSNGGFYSGNQVTNNGYLEFQTSEIYSRKMLGLSSQDNGSSESSIDFAFYLEWGGYLRVYENGSWRGSFNQISSSDILKIAVENGVVKYYLNNELLYVSDQAPNLPLIADGTIQDIGGTITNARITNPTQGVFQAFESDVELSNPDWKINGISTGMSDLIVTLNDLSANDIITCSTNFFQGGCGNIELESNSIKIIEIENLAAGSFFIEGIVQPGDGIAEEEVVWNPQSMVNVSNIENDLTKIQGYNQYNAGASSLNTVKNNGYFSYTVTETNKSKTIGLSTNDQNYSYSSTDYAMVIGTNSRFTIYESGSWRLGNQYYTFGDILRIAVENNTVKYYRNEDLIYTSNVVPQLPLLVDVALSSEGGTVNDAVVGNEIDAKFSCHYTDMGNSPIIEWFVNGFETGEYGEELSYDEIENGDIVTCTITPDFGSCNESTSFESNFINYIGPPTRTDWTGEVNNQWHNEGNWSHGVPTAQLSARIPAGTPNNPRVSTTVKVRNVVVENGGKLRVSNNGNLVVYGDFSISGSFNPGNGLVTFTGNGDKKIEGGDVTFGYLVIDLNEAESVINLKANILIKNKTQFLNGILNATDFAVTYMDDSFTQPGNVNSYINGQVRKIGNTAFEFPIGFNGVFAPVKISAPQNSSDEFSAQYFPGDPNDNGLPTDSQDGTFNTISSCEYWSIKRVHGASAVKVSLSYENERSCGIQDPSFLQIAHWNGTEWENKEQGSFEGDAESGFVQSLTNIDDFSPFTLGSSSGINPLPVELATFNVTKSGDGSSITWSTNSEVNNSHFTIERSQNAADFHEIATVEGAGTSHQTMSYSYLDINPNQGINYYRLSQTDFDGSTRYYDIQSVNFQLNKDLTIYPNPNNGSFNIVRKSDDFVKLRLIDLFGKTRWEKATDQTLIRVSVQGLSKGIYFLEFSDGRNSFTEKVIIE